MKITLFSPDASICAAWHRANEDYSVVEVLNDSLETLPPHTAIVSAGNSYGVMTGGIDYAVREKFGQGVQDAVQNYILSRRGLISIGEAVAVRVEHESAEHVIYAPTMTAPELISDYEVFLATFASVCCAINIKCETIAIPGLGMGVGAVESEAGARAMRLAIESALKFKT